MSAAPRLIRVLAAMADGAGIAAQFAAIDETAWASATFVGALHTIGMTAEPSAARTAWLATLSEAAFVLPGHIVADVAARPSAAGGTLSILTLAEA